MALVLKRYAVLIVLAAGCGGSTPTSVTPSPGNSPAASPAASFSFQETFSVEGAWPGVWRPLGGVAASSVTGGWGRLTPVASGYSLARMGVAAAQRDFEVTFALSFEDVRTQGIGFYVRQNGGYLALTPTHGGGYAVFVEGFRGSRLGVWREVDGIESEILAVTQLAAPLASNVPYQARFRVTQASSTSTRLQARVWEASQPEPGTWLIDIPDGTPSLQGASGGIAVDSYSSATRGPIAAGTLIRDIHVN